MTGRLTSNHDAAQAHIDAILALPYINADAIRKRKFKIVLDTVNGAGGPIMHKLLTQLGADVVGMNLEPTGKLCVCDCKFIGFLFVLMFGINRPICTHSRAGTSKSKRFV